LGIEYLKCLIDIRSDAAMGAFHSHVVLNSLLKMRELASLYYRWIASQTLSASYLCHVCPSTSAGTLPARREKLLQALAGAMG
jgi:hypothetical protein